MTESATIQAKVNLPRPEPIDDKNPAVRSKLLRKHKISEDEYTRVIEIMGRTPTFAELGVFSSMWSEHCSYKSSRVHLKRFPTSGDQVVVPPGENAGVVRLSGKLCVAFKMESHNHPSYIEPYQGAATGVGGILRDVFCMGSRPIANLNCLRFGERSHERTPYLFSNVVKGIGDYGNCVGIPTVGGNISFDKTYNGNCLVNAMTVGLIHEDQIFKGFASGIGNLVVYVGSATGRDGIHGATMASDSFDTQQQGERSTVQVGDPFTEKLLLEATLEVLEKGLVVGLQDMGAAGLTSSSFEMAERAGSGLYLDLDKVPFRAQNLSAYELMLSESQERMLMVIEPNNWEAIAEVFEKWQLAYAVIGMVTDSKRVQATYQGKLEIDIPVGPITDNAPRYERPMAPSPIRRQFFDAELEQSLSQKNIAELLEKVLRDSGDKSPVFRQYDHHIGTKTIFGPDSGGAAVLWTRSPWQAKEDEHVGIAISTACNERLCGQSAFQGAAHAVLKSARQIAAAGGQPLGATDCLNFGNPEDPRIMRQFSDAVDGISLACNELNTPIVSGNVSLYNETDGKSILPTPMIGMVGRVKDMESSRPAILSRPATLFWLKTHEPHWAGSLVAKVLGYDETQLLSISEVDWEIERGAIQVLNSSQAQFFAARDIGESGLAATIIKLCNEMSFTASVDLDLKDWLGADSGYILATDLSLSELQTLNANLTWIELGNVSASPSVHDFGKFKLNQEVVRTCLSNSLRF